MDVDKLLALSEAATPGPWMTHVAGKCHARGALVDFYDVVTECDDDIAEGVLLEDAAFIAAAREHFPEALRRLKRLAELQNKIYYCKVSAIDPMCIALRASLTEAEMKELRELLDLPAQGASE